MGHGVHVGGGIVLTAAHVINGASGPPTCSFIDSGRQAKGIRIGASEPRHLDLGAVLIQPPSGITASRITRSWPATSVRSIRSEGRAENIGNRTMLWTGMSIQGDSGAPVWNRDGIVSIVSRGPPNNTSETIGPAPEAVYSFLCNVSRMWNVPRSSCGLPTSNIPANFDPVPRRPPGDPAQEEDDRYNPRPYPDPNDTSRSLDAGDNVPTLAAANVDEMVEQATIRVLGRIAKDSRFRGPTGPVGPPGPPGSPGKAGPAGRDGEGIDPATLASIDAKLTAIQVQQRELKKRFSEASFPVQVVTPSGDTEEGKVHIEGGMLRLDLSSLK